MKKIYLAYLLLALLSACGSTPTPHSISLSGEIKGLGNDTIYIYGADELYHHIDTLIVTKGKFAKTLELDTLVAAWLLFKDGSKYPLFMNKGDELQIKGSSGDLSSFEVTGNLPNEELNAFQKELKGLAKPSEKVLEEKAEAFITSHSSSVVSVYLLEKYFVNTPNPDIPHIKTLINSMTGELKDRPFVMNLLDRIQEEEKVAHGKICPHISLPNAEGEDISRSSFKDKYLLIHFWASWDEHSVETNAAIRRIYKKEAKNESLAFWGISLDVDREAWKNAVERDTLKWEQSCDFMGWETDPVKKLSVYALPSNILLSTTGRIEGRNMTPEEIEEKIEEIKKKEEERKERVKEIEKTRKEKSRKKS